MNQFLDHPIFITTVTFGADGVITVDENLTIVQFNQSAEIILGYQTEDVIGRPLYTLFFEKSDFDHTSYISNFAKAGLKGRNMADHKLVKARHADGSSVLLKAYIYQTTYDGKNYFTAIIQSDNKLQKNNAYQKSKKTQNNTPSFNTSPRLTPYTHSLPKIGIIEHTLSNDSVFWSTEVYEILGLDSKQTEVSPSLFAEYVHPEDKELIEHMCLLSQSTNQKYHIRHRLLLPDDNVKYIERRCETFVDQSNTVVRILEVIQDISEQVSSFKHQCHLQELLLKTEELAKTGSWEINLDNNETYFSPEFLRLHNMNYAKEPQVDLTAIAYRIHPHDRQLFNSYMKQKADQNTSKPILYRVTGPRGKTRYLKAKSELEKTNNDNSKSIHGFAQDITSYVNAEQSIHKSSELLRAVIDTTHICIAHLNCDMNFVLVNKAYADTDAKSPEYFTGKNHFDLYPNKENEAIFRNVINSGKAYTATAKPFEYVGNPERGVTHWDWTATPVKDGSGKTSGLVLTLLNVTDRINALEAAATNENKLSLLNEELENSIKIRTKELKDERNFIDAVLETQGAYVTVLNYYGHVVIFNKSCEDCTGYKKIELANKPLWDILIPADEKPAMVNVFDALVSTARPSRIENHWITKNGEKRLIEWSNTVLKGEDGLVKYIVMTGIDITENRQTELLLKRAAGNLEVAQRITKIGDWEYDVSSEKLWWSEEYVKILGLAHSTYTPSKELYLNCVHKNDRNKAYLAISQLIEKGYKDITLRFVTPEGDVRVVHEIAHVEYDKTGNPLLLRGTVQDITDITKAEAERNQLQRQLQQAHKMESIGQLTGGIAHDFNNILAAILGFTRLAKTRFAPEDEGSLSEYLQEIEKAGQRASSLVKQMLAFSRGDTQDFTLLDPLPIIKESVNMLRSTISSSINIILELTNENCLIETNALQLQQSIINLIINARDALNGKGEIYIKVISVIKRSSECISCHKIFSGEHLAIEVRDNGCGIQPDILYRIFEPFFTTKPIGDGTGMGLAMVHGFVHSSGGHLEVDINSGHNTTFRLFFPISAKAEQCSDRVAIDNTPPSANLTPQYNILVVDDEESVIKYLKECLSMHNYGVEVTTSSREALELLSSNLTKYDLLITDQSMPELTGEDLIKEARKLIPNLPIILCSGYSDLVDKDIYENIGATFFLAKPVDQTVFLEAVNQLVSKS